MDSYHCNTVRTRTHQSSENFLNVDGGGVEAAILWSIAVDTVQG